MYSCELFYEDAYDFQDEKHQLHQTQQQQQQQQQGLLLNDTYPKLQPLLDYTPDLVPNDTPDDDPLTSFDELCMPTSSSPQVSSYLQYLKEPSAAVDYSNVMMPVMPTVDDCWPGIDTTTNSLLLCPSAMLPETANTGDWFCETADAYFGDFCNEHNSNSTDDGIQRDSFTGMTREYVSLSDVNSFVAEADSQKHAASIHLSYSTPENLQFLGNDESLAQLTSFASVPAALANLPQQHQPLPPPSPEHDDSDSETVSSTRSTSYWKGDMWKTSYDKAALKRSRRKINRKKSDIFPKHRRNKKSISRSSLPVSESISTFLSRQKLSDDEEPHQHPVEEDYDMEEEDDEYVFRGDGQSSTSLRKGRNVDKACNHCKRSHLRCDNMRPCRRCVATGKTGCKDVEHKPRGRPRLNKNQHSVKNRGL